ncbi:serine/threonine-protein kinase [Streptomyces sp. NPDC059009]|uniref:serine/threonine-protein kinase n=1 Tax=Streptomyces sp. NPDC059009 TaxID=3346694 RepID=UPI0036BFC025
MSNDGGRRAGPGDGRLIGGRYRLGERIGSGGMGTVWGAVDELVGRDVAVKEPRLPGDPHGPARERMAARLYREARAAARVEHPAAVAIHDVVVEDGLPWIVMELIRGESLHEVLQRGALPPAESARIGLAVVGALGAAHAKGIVHRDVKPANVLIGAHGRVVLTDFGIAHVQGEESLTMSGEFVGSLEFIAPERMSGRGAGPESDLWSLGVLLYAAVEGWSPFRRTTVESTLAAVLSAEVPKPVRAGELGPLIEGLLMKVPEARPGVGDVALALAAVAEGRALPDAFTGPQPPAQDPSGMRELADDVGTMKMGRPAAKAAPEPDTPEGPTVTSGPDGAAEPSRRTPALIAAALAGALLVGGGIWVGVSVSRDDESSYGASASEGGDSGEIAPPREPETKPDPWKVRRESKIVAELSVPRDYQAYAREDSDTNWAQGKRLVEYGAKEGDGAVLVRLTRHAMGSTPALTWARQMGEFWKDNDNNARSNYTKTSFHGYDAAIADTTYDDDQRAVGDATRCMQLGIITDDQEFYELRVDMPKGTKEEKKGTGLFKGVRERLKIGKAMVNS